MGYNFAKVYVLLIHIIKAKFCLFLYLLLLHDESAEGIKMKFGIRVDYGVEHHIYHF